MRRSRYEDPVTGFSASESQNNPLFSNDMLLSLRNLNTPTLSIRVASVVVIMKILLYLSEKFN